MIPELTPDARKYMAAIGSVGGKVVTEKKKAHLARIAAQGGAKMTDKRRAHLAWLAEARRGKKVGGKAEAIPPPV